MSPGSEPVSLIDVVTSIAPFEQQDATTQPQSTAVPIPVSTDPYLLESFLQAPTDHPQRDVSGNWSRIAHQTGDGGPPSSAGATAGALSHTWDDFDFRNAERCLDEALSSGAVDRRRSVIWEEASSTRTVESEAGVSESAAVGAADLEARPFGDQEYVQILSKQLVGVYLSIWVRRRLLPHISGVQATTVATGVMGYLANKGRWLTALSPTCEIRLLRADGQSCKSHTLRAFASFHSPCLLIPGSGAWELAAHSTCLRIYLVQCRVGAAHTSSIVSLLPPSMHQLYRVGKQTGSI